MTPPSSNQECHICLEELQADLVAVPCGHVFHHTCVMQALQVNRQCPICRRSTNDTDIIALYFNVSTACNDEDGKLQSQNSVQPSGDNAVLSSRINTLMERVQWQNKQQERLVNELRRLRGQIEQLLYDKETLAQRVGGLEATKNELSTKVARYQIELSRQMEASRRSSVNQSIIHFLDTCDASAMEEEIRNPRELIMALKKACKFRHDQYEKVVKEKMRLKELLRNAQPQFAQQQVEGNIKMMKSKARSATFTALENKSACSSLTGRMVVETKKRKIESPSMSADVMSFCEQQVNDEDIKSLNQFEAAGSRAVAYSDVPIRPSPSSRQAFGRSNFNLSQYGAFSSTPLSQPPLQNPGPQVTVCRRGYGEAGKLTSLLFPKEDDPRSGSRKKPVPSMQHLLNAQPVTSSQQQQRIVNNDRQQYALTNWLRNN